MTPEQYGYFVGFVSGHAEWGQVGSGSNHEHEHDPYAQGYRAGRHAASESINPDEGHAMLYFAGAHGARFKFTAGGTNG
jgi:hypothetical protein